MPPTSQYTCPVLGTPTTLLWPWLNEAVQEGDSWLKAQRPTTEWESVLDLLAPDDTSEELTDQSNTHYAKAQRIARELVASISNFRHEGEFKVQWDQSLYPRAHALTKRDRDWYRSTYAYDEYRRGIQYAVALGTTYFVETWDKGFGGPGFGDVRLEAFAPDAVTFVQLPRDHDIQRAYMVLLRYEYPINLAKRLYPNIAHLLTPDRENASWIQKGLEKIQKLLGGSPVARFFAGVGAINQKKSNFSYPVVDIYHAYIMDNTVNETGHPMTMGAHDTNWEYTVPSLGDPIPIGVTDPSTGQMATRAASNNDCQLFPLRRLCIFSKSLNAIDYDGSSPWWHGRVPVERIRFNDWPWEAMGQSLIGPIRTMQQGVEAMLRAIDDATVARLDPPVAVDEAIVDEGFEQNYNPRKGGSRFHYNSTVGAVPVQFPFPAQYYDIPNWVPEHIIRQESRMDYLTAVQDLTAIAKAKQIPSADALEKILEMAGPMVQDMVRSLERPLWALGEMRKAYYFQFDTRRRMLTLLGSDDLVEEEVEYSPELIVPLIEGESYGAQRERARRSIHEFHYHLTSHAISELHRMTSKLFFLQLMKIGFPIDWWTYARIAEIPNFGPDPVNQETGKPETTVLGRWLCQKDYQISEQRMVGQKGQAGRPQSGQAPPKIVSKEGGARSTVTTS